MEEIAKNNVEVDTEIPAAPVKRTRFQLVSVGDMETVDLIEFDEALLPQLIDVQTATCRPFKNGGMYTVVPHENNAHTIRTLQRLKMIYERFNEPVLRVTSYMSLVDGLMENVGLLFNKVTYKIISKPSDLDALINPPKYPGYTFETVSYNILGDLLTSTMEADKSGTENA